MSCRAFAITSSSGYYATKQLIWWLTGATYKTTSPGYVLIECDDGTRRDKPTGGTAEGIPTANKWSPSNSSIPPADAWAVLQSPDSERFGTTHFQIFIQNKVNFSDHAIKMYMFPYEDWVVDPTPNPAPSDLTPTRPTREISQANFVLELPVFHLFANADEYALNIIKQIDRNNVTKTLQMSYSGEATVLEPRGAPFTVSRPWVQSITPIKYMHENPFNGNFGYYTESEQLVLQGDIGYDRPIAGGDHMNDQTEKVGTFGGAFQMFNISVGFFDQGTDAHGMRGTLRNSACLNGAAGMYGFTFGKEWVYFSENPATRNCWALRWDGVTPIYEGDENG